MYAAPEREDIMRKHSVEIFNGEYAREVAPNLPGPIVLRDRAIVAQWGMIPSFSPTRIPSMPDGRKLSTNNCRREGMAKTPTFGNAWRRGQRCLIPANSYIEPNWTSGRNIWWRLWRADGEPWALAGLWSEWQDPESGWMVPNFTLITQNCDSHPLLNQMHKPDLGLPPDQQDKRCPVPLEPSHWGTWLHGTNDEAEALIQLPPVEIYRDGPVSPIIQGTLF